MALFVALELSAGVGFSAGQNWRENVGFFGLEIIVTY
jgi:hypothetical protein